MNTAKETNVKSIAVISLVSVMLFGIFYYLVTDATSTPSTELKTQVQKVSEQAVAQNSLGEAAKASEKPAEVKGDSTEVSVFKALSTQKTNTQPKMVLSGSDTQTPESTVPDTGSETIFGAFVLSSLTLFVGIYLMMTQPRNTALAKFEKRIIRELD